MPEVAVGCRTRGRQQRGDSNLQLDLFGLQRLNYETTYPIWPDGREALAGVPAANGRGTRSDEPASRDAADSGGTDRNGTGPASPAVDPAGSDAAIGARPSLGNGAGEIHLPAARDVAVGQEFNGNDEAGAEVEVSEPEPPRNQNNFRITYEDRIGIGTLKHKCRDNLAAIALLKKLEAENRPATEDEKRVLVRYVGWGGLPQVFDALNESWKKERAHLESLLTTDELESARATTLNAHYTAPVVVRAMYAALQRFGFRQGRVLEPAAGLGHFIGLMPDEMKAGSRITGIEIDSITVRLARKLYPDADLRHQPFEETKLADGFYDVAISNILFGDYKPFDPKFKSWNFVIHDYSFAKALDKVRPGGLVLFITSHGTLDKMDGALREYISNQADLLGAIRLPNDAFKKNANTEVTTDIVMLRKRLPGELPNGSVWKELVEISDSAGETIPVNEYFAAHPEMMLGEMRPEGKMYARSEPTLIPNQRPLAEQLPEVIALLPKDVFKPKLYLNMRTSWPRWSNGRTKSKIRWTSPRMRQAHKLRRNLTKVKILNQRRFNLTRK